MVVENFKKISGIKFPFKIDVTGKVAQSDFDILKKRGSKISESVEQIISVSIGEVWGEKEFGSNVLDLVFKPLGKDTSFVNLIKSLLLDSLQKWEERINVLDIQIKKNKVNIEYLVNIKVVYEIVSTGKIEKTAVQLNGGGF